MVQALGQVFMKRPFDDPFSAVEAVLKAHPLGGLAQATIVDIHAEATSEKMAMGHWCDGRASLVVGTHTHVPTGDAQILSGGTAYQTDAGMCGDYDSVIGMDKLEPLRRFITGMAKARFEPAAGEATLSGVYVETDDRTGQGHAGADDPAGRAAGTGAAMMRSQRLGFVAALLGLGIGWGSTQSLGKIAVSTGHGHFGLIFWQLVVGVGRAGRGAAGAAAGLSAHRGGPALCAADRGDRHDHSEHDLLHLGRASAGGDHVDPDLDRAAARLSHRAVAGDGPLQRDCGCSGLLCGFLGVALIALPQAALPERGGSGLAGGRDGRAALLRDRGRTVVARWGTAGMDPVQAIFAASVVGMVLVLPLVLISGQWIDPTAPSARRNGRWSFRRSSMR